MKHILILFFLFSLVEAKPLEVNVSSEGAILINAKTGAILFEKNGYEQCFPASTTKIATALYALKLRKGHLEEKVVARREAIASISPQAKRQSNYRSPPHWLETDGSHVGIKRGEEFPLHDLLRAMLISSANDASNVIAQHIGGTIPKFIAGLNLYLQKLGCRGTAFNNPHGLHHPKHVTTPYDLALIMREGLKDPNFREIISTVRYTCPETNLEYERTFVQTNRLLRRGSYFYDRAIGGKTGTTQAAGKNLVAVAEEDGRELIAVALGCRGSTAELYRDVTELFEAAFSEQKMRRYLLPKGVQKLTTKVPGARGKLKTYLPKGLYYDFYPSEECPVKARVVWKLPESLPIPKGTKVALLRVSDAQGNIYQEASLYTAAEVKAGFWHLVIANRMKVFWIAVALLVLFLLQARKRNKGRRSSRPLF